MNQRCGTCKHFGYIPTQEHLGKVCKISGQMPEHACWYEKED